MVIEKSTLYICPTPIGNLEDITLRVLSVLEGADIIAAEDTRRSLTLLAHFGIKTPLTSYHEHNKYDKADEIISMLQGGAAVALVSDAGTPVISDPGEVLVQKAIACGVNITALPGACAATVALSASGLSAKGFTFVGFLPQKSKELARALEAIKESEQTLILYEAPHRIKKTMRDLFVTLGDRKACIARELTKIHEEFLRCTLSQAISHFEETEPKGEFVIILEGEDSSVKLLKERERFKELTLKEHVSLYTSQGLTENEAIRQVAKDLGVSKRDVYNEVKVEKREESIEHRA